MSMTLVISFHGAFTQNFGPLVEELAQRLGSAAALVRMTRYRRDAGNARESVSYSDGENPKPNLKEWAEDVLGSPDTALLDFYAAHDDGEPILTTMWLYGGAGSRFEQASQGAIELSLAANSFREGGGPYRVDDEPPTWAQMLDQSTVRWRYDRARSFFAHIVGLEDDGLRRFGVRHSMARVDGVSGMPITSFFIFHSDVLDFVLDLEYLRRRFTESVSSVMLYAEDLKLPDKERLEKTSLPLFRPISEWIPRLTSVLKTIPEEEIEEFFERLDGSMLSHLRSLSAEELAFRVELAAKATGWEWVAQPTGAGGVVYGTLHEGKRGDFRTLFGFYSKLLDICDEERGV
ncbi:MAG: hypothetical protein ACNA8W_17815 [Bradymonadaceae bacterium]